MIRKVVDKRNIQNKQKNVLKTVSFPTIVRFSQNENDYTSFGASYLIHQLKLDVHIKFVYPNKLLKKAQKRSILYNLHE